MEKFSVKKPFTVLVAVIMVLVLGFVSITRMTTDLLPEMSLPYMIVITTYPGASPERVEVAVTQPMESSLGTVSGVKNVTSTSAENYSMVQLEFEDGTDMDSAMVKVSSAVQKVSTSLPDLCAAPQIMEISMDMMATMYVAVSREGYDIFALSDYVEDTVKPYLERQEGVASISGVGLVEQTIHVSLDQAKIDAVNDKLLEKVSSTLADAKKKLDDAQKQVTDGKAALAAAQSSFGSTMSNALLGQLSGSINGEVSNIKTMIDTLAVDLGELRELLSDETSRAILDEAFATIDEINALLAKPDRTPAEELELTVKLNELNTQLVRLIAEIRKTPDAAPAEEPVPEPTPDATADPDTEPAPEPTAEPMPVPSPADVLLGTLARVETGMGALSSLLDKVAGDMPELKSAVGTLTQAQLEAAVGFSTAQVQLTQAEAQLTEAKKQYEASRDTALESANLDQLLNIKTLAQLIYAQNFSMPAGYIDDAADNTWLLKVGDEYDGPDSIENAVLCNVSGIGDVRLSDVANVTVLDNADQTYARLNGEQAAILCVFKGSTAGTNDVAEACLAAFDELEEKYEGTHFITLVNQGDYITMIVNSVVSSMVLGAALAILILALFLKDIKPTLVVGFSIPLSVLFAVVLMYFTNISLNMMSLSGLALGIGMLVDNSIVVIENIYRLRGRGIAAPRAAVQGTKQVAGSIIASTLTTICVFLPLVFTSGTVRELLMPMGLCIGYCLIASLVVAMTVVPASASTLLRNAKPKEHPLFEKIQNAYGASLAWCLRFKLVPLVVAGALLVLCIWQVMRMGIVMIPAMSSDQIEVNVTTPKDATRAESYQMADDVMNAILSVENVSEVGVMDSGSTSGLLGGMTSGASGSYGGYVYYVSASENAGSAEIDRICADILEATKDMDCEVTASAGGMSDLTSMVSGGLSVSVYGNDLETLRTLSDEVAGVVADVEGFTDVTTSFTNGDQTIHLAIDKDEAMRCGVTVAQIFAEISSRLTTSSTATTVTVNGADMDVVVEDVTDPLTLENLMDIEFETSGMDDEGKTTKTKHTLGEFATKQYTTSVSAIKRENQTRYSTVSATTAEGYNTTLLSRTLAERLDAYTNEHPLPDGYSVDVGGESTQVNQMVSQMTLMILLGLIFIYLVMVAQFQSLLSPFIVLFTVPLAFTGGLLGLLATGQQLSLLSLMGFVVLMGTVVNNGIVFVDYTNQLRIGGMERRAALIATGKTRMRPIFMTAITTILAMCQLIFGDDMGSQLGGGMAIVIASGLAYATLMTLYIVPVMYDIFFKKPPLSVDVGGDDLDDVPDDAAEFIAEDALRREKQQNWPGDDSGVRHGLRRKRQKDTAQPVEASEVENETESKAENKEDGNENS